MKYLLYLLILGSLTQGCTSGKIKNKDQAQIIRMSVDSALEPDPTLKSGGFWIDFSKAKFFDREAINDFLNQYKYFTEVNSDSLLRHNITWVQYKYLENTLITFKKVEIRGSTIKIYLDKIRASDGFNKIEITIEKVGNEYFVISSRVMKVS